jgi:hypothetical protein
MAGVNITPGPDTEGAMTPGVLHFTERRPKPGTPLWRWPGPARRCQEQSAIIAVAGVQAVELAIPQTGYGVQVGGYLDDERAMELCGHLAGSEASGARWTEPQGGGRGSTQRPSGVLREATALAMCTGLGF